MSRPKQTRTAPTKAGDPRVRQLFQSLRSVLDLIEDISLRPYREPVAPAHQGPPCPVPPPEPERERLAYSIREIQALTGISRSTIYIEIQEGRLRASKRGRRTLILAQDLRAWIEGWKAGL